jgi:hypothetical protein
MCDNQECLKQQCPQYDKCWFLKVKCSNCNKKVDVRDCNKTKFSFLPTKDEVEVIYCSTCKNIIW